MIFLWIYLIGLTICLLGGTVTALYEKRKFDEDNVSKSAWGSIILYAVWWPLLVFLYIICLPFEIIDNRKGR
ncbi:membrane protein [Streptomyces phage MeganTheeKilla]|uniref:Membrane protein n=1 Tax=Streptomyces phage MeganTheeKilla TaxID=2801897 RepID=A0A7U0J732_9CAUD|nr:membrane protein [Streptomyces phage MeganTheeKilla]